MYKMKAAYVPAVVVVMSLSGCHHSDETTDDANSASGGRSASVAPGASAEVKPDQASTAAPSASASTHTTIVKPAPTRPVVVVPVHRTTSTTHTAVVQQPAMLPPATPINLHPTVLAVPRAPLVGGGGASSTVDTAKMIAQRMQADRQMTGSHLNVNLDRNTITLQGSVNSIAQKDRAEAIVLEVQKASGRQTSLQDELTVDQAAPAATATAPAAPGAGGPVVVP